MLWGNLAVDNLLRCPRCFYRLLLPTLIGSKYNVKCARWCPCCLYYNGAIIFFPSHASYHLRCPTGPRSCDVVLYHRVAAPLSVPNGNLPLSQRDASLSPSIQHFCRDPLTAGGKGRLIRKRWVVCGSIHESARVSPRMCVRMAERRQKAAIASKITQHYAAK